MTHSDCDCAQDQAGQKSHHGGRKQSQNSPISLVIDGLWDQENQVCSGGFVVVVVVSAIRPLRGCQFSNR